MMVRVLLATVLGAAVMFVYGFLFWGVSEILDGHIDAVPNGDALAGRLKQDIAETGVYFHPGRPDSTAAEDVQQAWEKKHKAGPLYWIIIQKEGSDPHAALMYVRGFAHMLGLSLMASVLLYLAAPALESYLWRWLFVGAVGLAIGVAFLSDAIWFHHPWRFTLMLAGSQVVQFLLAGLVLAALINVPPKAELAT